MGLIRVLADSLIDRIAAGEVVERPASVVKELVENSLDAAASSVELLVEGGGKRRIRVRDDGSGMDRDDALLALERHATSKIRHSDDLRAIRSLGFRGEALSSIAAVSQFVLASSDVDGQGTEVRVHGGRIEAVEQKGLPRGTSIDVARLFFNVPARRKFLRTEGTELARIVRVATRYALARPDVRFKLEQGGRTLLQAAAASSRLERIAQIYGRELSARLLPFELSRPGLAVSGFAGRPVDARPNRDGQHLFVNGRAVQDRVLNHAVMDAYGNTMARGRFALLFLFVEIDPEEVDVNVHPQKHEVRFHHASRVHDAVREAIGSSFSDEAAVPRWSELRPASAQAAGLSGVARATLDYLELAEHSPARGSGPARYGAADRVRENTAPPIQEDLVDVMHAAEPERSARRAQALAQYRDSYILAQDASGLVIVDQHAAHERVLFERYRDQAERDGVEIQQLMFPVILELAAGERIVIEQELDEFRRLGFRIEPFGEDAVRLTGVPAVAAEVEPEQLLRELLGEAKEARSAKADVAELRHLLVATSAACQAAIKINHRLALEGMQSLLDDLFGMVNPTTCPHGRPIVFRLSLEEIERTFQRR